MITKNNIISGTICGLICVAFMWVYMFFTGMSMNMKMGKEHKMQNMHMMPNGEMMMNDGSDMDMGEMTMNEMVDDMKGKKGRELEKAFLNGMIPHHQGAVDMAKLLLQDKTIRPEFVKFANDIITAQEKEIEMQKEWLNTLFK
jgi:uncharacterized protein (DUF305 family)